MKRKLLKPFAIFVLVNMLYELCFPIIAHALTSGPSQPEFSSFEPVNTTQMVDPFSGDFNYNIPLIDIEGYPINISYHSGISTDQEASWVGLGWNINAGVINRAMRGIPDDFKGDQVQTQYNMKKNITNGVKIGGGLEFFGLEKNPVGAVARGSTNLGASIEGSLGIFYNNYRGVGIEYSVNPGISAGIKGKSILTANLGIGYNSQNGINTQMMLSAQYKGKKNDDLSYNGSASVGMSSNSRAGLLRKSFQLGVGMETSEKPNKVEKLGASNDFSSNGGSAISYSKPSFVPQIQYPMDNFGFSIRGKIGFAGNWIHPNASLEYYYSSQTLKNQEKTANAYGYMYLEHAKEVPEQDVMMDFNREKDGDVSLTRPNLPVTNMTFDIYSVAGQGIGGNYRPFRGETGSVYDPLVENTGNSYAPGIEVGLPDIVHIGGNINVSSTYSASGKWSANNYMMAQGFTDYRDPNSSVNSLYEACYFKQVGEKTECDPVSYDDPFYNPTGAYRFALTGLGRNASLTSDIQNQWGNKVSTLSSSNVHLNNRVRRNQQISFLTTDEAKNVGVNPSIESYPLNKLPTMVSPTIIPRDAPGHHTAEISTTKSDGTRYIYGIPTYNTTQEDVCFNIGTNPSSQGYVHYKPGTDDATSNKQGKDNFFRKTALPAYAYGYLLTEVLSPDYVDLYNDGVTPDDLGTGIKFNYTKYFGKSSTHHDSTYKWRAPYGSGGSTGDGIANYDEGFKSVHNDNKASYVYGEKEIWYLHSVVTKNYVAQFYLSNRQDGLGVAGKFGGRDTMSKLQKLDSIVLFSRSDLLLHGANAVKIQAVHFTYDYTLCPNVENNNHSGGKLTLKKIYFTYGTSNKGKFSPYTFNYSGVNYPYQFTARDRWGMYKPDSSTLPDHDFPYVNQSDFNATTGRSKSADRYAQLWQLTQINLPSGGTIKVSYESDDYAYVQDKPAMQMFKIAGLGLTPVFDPSNYLFVNGVSNYYIHFKLPVALTKQQLKDYCIRDMSRVYFKCLMNVNARTHPQDYDYVPGFADIEDVGVCSSSETVASTTAWIKLKQVQLEDKYVFSSNTEYIQPIAKSTWEYSKVNFPAKIYPGSDDDGTGGGLDFLTGVWDELEKKADGFYTSLRNDGYAEQMQLDKSWIRLYSPTSKKAGGGSRVKQITISDNWSNMVTQGNGTNTYGQTFTYTTIENGREISSGVANWEPAIGNDENPFFDLKVYSDEKVGAVSDFHQVLLPMGESFAPSASVGYSEVKVTDLTHAGVPGTGYTVHKFYTAKDFPVKFEETDIAMEHEKDAPNFFASFLGMSNSEDDLTVSQGYSVSTNDMHGKPLSTQIFDNGNNPISSVNYYYRRDNSIAGSPLRNTVPVIDGFGIVNNKRIGVDIEMVGDTRQNYSDIEADDIAINIDLSFIGAFPIPLPVPSGFPSHTSDRTRLRSSVLTRVVQQSGLLDSVVAVDQFSRICTSNLAYDGETGEVLLTRTQNAYNDNVYNFTYPAHWAYEGMGAAYRNDRFVLDNVSFSKGEITSAATTSVIDNFVSGDELYLYNTSTPRKIWAYRSGATPIFLERDGSLVDSISNASIKVVRSGRRNMQSVPIGTVTTLQNPLINDTLNFKKVLNASAAQYSDQWQLYICGTDKSGHQCTSNSLASVVNPFVKGVRGDWRKKSDMVYVDVRKQSSPTNARTDGQFNSFYPYWHLSYPYAQTNDTSKHWTWMKQVTQYSPYGFEIENKDALNNYTAALYGYNNSLPLAVASNSKYSAIAYDGFEDYFSDTIGIKNPAVCFRSPHWNLKKAIHSPQSAVYSGISHTGTYSLLISPSYCDTIDLTLHNCPAQTDDPSLFREFFIKPEDCIVGFSPDTGKYVFSMWVRQDSSCAVNSYKAAYARVVFNTSTIYDVSLLPSGEIIEGWQKVEGTVYIPNIATRMRIILRNTSMTSPAYLDDLRFYPFNGNMKSFAYDPVSLRAAAELDENNYATFYEYDEEGKLVRVKKETAKGIMTIQEGRRNVSRIK